MAQVRQKQKTQLAALQKEFQRLQKNYRRLTKKPDTKI